MKSFKNLNQIKETELSKRIKLFIPEKVYNKVLIKEDKDRLINLERYSKEQGFVVIIELVWDKMDIEKCLARSTIADKIKNISKKLSGIDNDLVLKITDVYRPIKLQKRIFREVYNKIKKESGKKGEDLYLEVTKFVADPKNVPPHSTGGAVDLTIFDLKNKCDLNMGTKINEISEKTETFSNKINETQRKNRKLLFNLMISEGFVNAPTEWWHYSFGDQYWGAFYGKDAIYNSK